MAAAITTTTTLTEIVNSEAIETLIQDYAIDAVVIAPLCRVAELAGRATLTASFPVWVKDSASSGVGQGTDLTLNDLETTENATITAGINGIYRELHEITRDVNILGPGALDAFIARDGGLLLGEALDNSLAALFSSFSTYTAGTSGNDCTIADLLSALASLRTANARGRLVAVLDDQQAADLALSAATTTAAVFANAAGNAQSIVNARSDGYLGNLFGLDCYYTNLTDTANSAADVSGAVFVDGNASPLYAAIGIARVHGPKVKIQPDAASVSDHISIYDCWGTGVLRVAMGVNLVTDA